MSRPLRIAFAGTGSIGQRHLRNLMAIAPDARPIFLRRNARQDAMSRDCGAKVVSDLSQVLDHGADGIVISTPSAMHAETLCAAIEADLPVYIEKPVVTSRADLETVTRLIAARPSLPSLIGCNLRFLPSLRRMHEMAQRDIGRLARGTFEAGQWLPDWRPSQDHRQGYSASAGAGGGVTFDLLHEIDIAEWICGPLEVAAATAAKVPALEIESEAVANILLTRADPGMLVSIGLDYIARRPLRQYRIVAEGGTLTWSLGSRRLEFDDGRTLHEIASGDAAFDMGQTYVDAMAEFIRAVRGGPQTSNPLQSGLSSNMLTIRAKELSC